MGQLLASQVVSTKGFIKGKMLQMEVSKDALLTGMLCHWMQCLLPGDVEGHGKCEVISLLSLRIGNPSFTGAEMKFW